MYKIELQWKEFNINLPIFEAQMKVAYEAIGYTGNQTNLGLELWFSEEPSAQIKEEIKDMWEAINEESQLAISYKSAAQIKADAEALEAAIVILKQDAIAKTWNQLSAVQRKALMGLPITQAEIDA